MRLNLTTRICNSSSNKQSWNSKKNVIWRDKGLLGVYAWRKTLVSWQSKYFYYNFYMMTEAHSHPLARQLEPFFGSGMVRQNLWMEKIFLQIRWDTTVWNKVGKTATLVLNLSHNRIGKHWQEWLARLLSETDPGFRLSKDQDIVTNPEPNKNRSHPADDQMWYLSLSSFNDSSAV